MSSYSGNLLTPPREEEEIYPYRRVWFSIVMQMSVVGGMAIGLFVVINYLGISIPSSFRPAANVALALLPASAWLVLSWWRERSVQQPRRRLLAVVVVSGLAANAIGYPLITEVLAVDRWLSLASAIDRIVGYTLTVGMIQEFIKYVIVRYMVWDDVLRVRFDWLAYGMASAVGYTTVLALHFVSVGDPQPDVVAARVFSIAAIQVAASLFVAYGLAESYFSDATFTLLPVSLLIGAAITGIAIPIRAGLVNAGISPLITIAAPSPLFGLGFSIGVIAAPILLVSFLFNNAETRERQARTERESHAT